MAEELAAVRLPDDAAAQPAHLQRVADGVAVPQLQRRLVADDADLLVAQVLLVAEEAPFADDELDGVEPVAVAGEDVGAVQLAVVGDDVLAPEPRCTSCALRDAAPSRRGRRDPDG